LFKTKHLEDFGYKQPYNALYLYSPETDIICFLRIVKFGIPIGQLVSSSIVMGHCFYALK